MVCKQSQPECMMVVNICNGSILVIIAHYFQHRVLTLSGEGHILLVLVLLRGWLARLPTDLAAVIGEGSLTSSHEVPPL